MADLSFTPEELRPVHRAHGAICRVSRILAPLARLLENQQHGIGAELALVAHEAAATATDDLERWLEETDPGIFLRQDQNKTNSETRRD